VLAVAAVVAAVAMPATAHATLRLLVPPASGRGVSAPIIWQARALIVQSLGRPGRFLVLDRDGPPTAQPLSLVDAGWMAQWKGAMMAVTVDVSREAGATRIQLTCVDAATAVQACFIEEVTVSGPETLPYVAERLALRLSAALGGRALPEHAIATRASGATSEPRSDRTITIGARTGVLVPVVAAEISPTILGGFSVMAGADAGYLLADVSAEYYGGQNHYLAGVSLGLFRPLASGRYTPYFGASVLWATQRIAGQGASGVQVRPTIGVMFGRHDVVRVRAELGGFVSIFEEREPDRLIVGAGQARVVRGALLSMGASF